MINRRNLLVGIPAAALMAHPAARALAQGASPSSAPRTGKNGVMLMNRIGPSASELYIANFDGTDERKLLAESVFDYHACYSADGKWIVFTSERSGPGQADIYRARPDGTAVERLTDNEAVDDQAALSPDGTSVAFVSTRETYKAKIWVLDLETQRLRNLTGQSEVQGDPNRPGGFFRPAWSPDGKWLAFSSDRNTEWRARKGAWEHIQELSVYVIGADGTGLRRVSNSQPGICAGSPKWSADGKRVVFYELPVEQTWHAHRPELVASATSQIVSVDVATGERIEHTSGPGLKVLPQFVTANQIGYLAKGGPNEGLVYTGGAAAVKGKMRSPVWSPDGKKVIYQKVDFAARPQNMPLYSWDGSYEYRYTDVFPQLSRDGKLVVTEKDADSSIVIMDPDGSNKERVFHAAGKGLAFAPSWSPDGQWIAFGFGNFFGDRHKTRAKIMMVRRDGTGAQDLTGDTPHSGFPSFSADGTRLVYRVWGEDDYGLRILNLEDRSVKVLTTQPDNLPGWSPDGSRIVFTRRQDDGNYDVFTIRPDGSDLRRLTSSRAVDGHAVWSTDGRHILWNSGMYGWRDEAALYDNTFQPYAPIFIMNADGTGKRPLTDSPWEDAMPQFISVRSALNQ
jgi:Tol biopolymer transport system component